MQDNRDQFMSVTTPEQLQRDRKPIKTIDAGNYNLMLKNVIRKEKNSYGNPYFLFVFSVIDGPEKENVVFHSVSPYLAPGKRLWAVLIALGKDPKSLEGGFKKEDLIGQKVTASVSINKNNKNSIDVMWPYQAPVSGAAPTVTKSVEKIVTSAPSATAPTAVVATTSTAKVPPAEFAVVSPESNKTAAPEIKGTKTKEVETSLDDISNLIEF